jgi:hypothetical protein
VTDDRETAVAVGGRRRVPVPDGVAHDYLLLALRLDQHVPGLIDGYYGPADLKARADIEELRPAARLVDDAERLLERIATDVTDPTELDRRDWLTAQVVALRTQADALAGHPLPYVEHVRACFAWEPVRRDEAVFDAAAAEIDRLLPGSAPLAERLSAWDDRFVIPPDRVAEVAAWLAGRFRERARRSFGLPDGEDLRIRLVSGQPWSGYNWFDGALRSRVDINTDLPSWAASLVHVLAHETYPGHHLEHAWKEADLVETRRRMEASILLINTPECLVSEGLADLGRQFVSAPDEDVELLLEVYERAGLAVAGDPVAARAAAETSVALSGPRARLGEARVNAALMRHADGRSHDEVLAWLERVGRFAPAIAAKRLEFIEHPLWRTYVFVYHEGEALLRRWLEAVPEIERVERFGRLLHEQLTPTAIAAELAVSPVGREDG